MKKTVSTKKSKKGDDKLPKEYRFNYREARPNHFAARYKKGSRVVVLDPDIAQVFTTPTSVNAVLRALLDTMPRTGDGATRKS